MVVLVALPVVTASARGQAPPHRGANLGICDEATTARPRIEGLDVCVRNLGDAEGLGVVFAELLDSTGTVLLRLDPDAGRRVVRVPTYDLGGKEGTLVRINPTPAFLSISAELERRASRYSVRATIQTLARDADPSDNAKVKEFSTSVNPTPDGTRHLQFAFRNDGELARQVRWVMHRFSSPAGWSIEGAPNDSASIGWLPGEELRGVLTIRSPSRLVHGGFAAIRLALVDASSRKVLREREWFLPFDTLPPFIANVRAILLADHSIAVQTLAGDEHSGLHEQRGLVLHHSIDGGFSWITETHRNRVGHYHEPTVFEFIIGPFAPGARVLIHLEARDRAGNRVSEMPEDANVFMAPANAERLAVRERSLSQPEKSRLFAVEQLQRLPDALRTQQNALNALGLTDSRATARSARRHLLIRRIADLQKELDELRTYGIDAGLFKRMETAVAPVAGRVGTTLNVSIP